VSLPPVDHVVLLPRRGTTEHEKAEIGKVSTAYAGKLPRIKASIQALRPPILDDADTGDEMTSASRIVARVTFDLQRIVNAARSVPGYRINRMQESIRTSAGTRQQEDCSKSIGICKAN
jgi:hypothetical protein